MHAVMTFRKVMMQRSTLAACNRAVYACACLLPLAYLACSTLLTWPVYHCDHSSLVIHWLSSWAGTAVWPTLHDGWQAAHFLL